MTLFILLFFFFFFNDTATTEIYTLSLHDALPISRSRRRAPRRPAGALIFSKYRPPPPRSAFALRRRHVSARGRRSEEHTSELQSQSNLVCRLLLEKKKNIPICVSANMISLASCVG